MPLKQSGWAIDSLPVVPRQTPQDAKMTALSNKANTPQISDRALTIAEIFDLRKGPGAMATRFARWKRRFWAYTEAMENQDTDSFKGLL